MHQRVCRRFFFMIDASKCFFLICLQLCILYSVELFFCSDCPAADIRGVAANQQVVAVGRLLLAPLHGRGGTVARLQHQGTDES